jgi:hypothetical protein
VVEVADFTRMAPLPPPVVASGHVSR